MALAVISTYIRLISSITDYSSFLAEVLLDCIKFTISHSLITTYTPQVMVKWLGQTIPEKLS
jgi:hypothetical protein